MIDEYSGLTFDWDDINFDDERVIDSLNELNSIFGDGSVWYRISSSGEGLHVMIGDVILDEISGITILQPTPMTSNEQIKYRKMFDLECRGRLISDSVRAKQGFRTSRIFNTKNGKSVSEWRRFK